MTTTINGRTPEEIRKGLEYCCPKWESDHWVTCRDECPFKNEGVFCRNVLMACTLALLYRLERERDELLQKNQQLERERDAAVDDLKEHGMFCSICMHEEKSIHEEPCASCSKLSTANNHSNWQWRGVQEVE